MPNGVWNGLPGAYAGPTGNLIGLFPAPEVDNPAYDLGHAVPSLATIFVLPFLAPEAEAERAAARSLSSAAAGDVASVPAWLNPKQAANLARFEAKLPAAAEETVVRQLPNGGAAFQAEVPGRVPGSQAIYEKQIDAAGNTFQYTKTTYDPAGKIVHVKDKIGGATFLGH